LITDSKVELEEGVMIERKEANSYGDGGRKSNGMTGRKRPRGGSVILIEKKSEPD